MSWIRRFKWFKYNLGVDSLFTCCDKYVCVFTKFFIKLFAVSELIRKFSTSVCI